jgi:uncharacterized caspase-like protein
MPVRLLAIAAVLAVLGLAGPARAATHRVAVVVGNNIGRGDLPPLRFAEDDAAEVGRVLVELGGVAERDLYLVRGGDRAAVDSALARARARVAALRRLPGSRVVLLFYFSGHSDGIAFELGTDRLPFAELRRWLGATGADVRLAVVDTCKSGALVAVKGGAPAPAFQIRLSDEVASSGEALLTSSAADEIALESREIGGSFFTHHLISGLRGAADTSGDGRVTLGEAYRYAYAHTISTTDATVAGAQHPVYDYRLSGQGELVITQLPIGAGRLVVPPGHDRALVVAPARHQVLAEVTAGALAPLAVPAGDYDVRAWLAGRPFHGRIRIAAGETRRVRWSELRPAPAVFTAGKGGDRGGVAGALGLDHGLAVSIAAGAQPGIADDVAALPSLRLTIGGAAASGARLLLRVGTARGDGFRESAALAAAGARWGTDRGRLRAWVGLDLGGGAIAQDIDTTRRRWTGAVIGGPAAGLALRVTDRVSLGLDGELTLAVLRRNGGAAAAWLPAGWLSAIVAL